MTISEKETYLRDLAPDPSLLDNVEQYAAQHNCIGRFKKIFYVGPSSGNIEILRMLCRYESEEEDPFSDIDSIEYVVFTIGSEKYAIVISAEPYAPPKSITYICGVGF